MSPRTSDVFCTQPALDRAIAFLVPPDDVDQSRLRRWHRPRPKAAPGPRSDRPAIGSSLRGDLLRQVPHFQAHVAAKILPLAADHQGNPVPLGHRGDDVDVGRSLGQAERQTRLDRRDFHAIDELRPAAAHLIGDADHVLIVLGRGEADVAVRPVAVVVAGDELALDAGDVQRAVQRRAELPGEDADVEGLPLLGRKDPAVGVARLVDDAVQGRRGGERRGMLGRRCSAPSPARSPAARGGTGWATGPCPGRPGARRQSRAAVRQGA